jgi:methylated-DNA-[protein]-cysteine S-methyltransferase
MSETCLQTAIGPITLTAHDGVLTGLHWREGRHDASPLLDRAAAQLAEYLNGTRTGFDPDLPLDWGDGLQAKVRRAMAAIPFGQTRTYGDIARETGAPAQAIGQACGANPLPILIPCHRVFGAKGPGGFSAKGGVETKVWLLRHEGAAGLLI